MARKFSELTSKMSRDSRERSDAIYRRLIAEMPLHELRHARALSQVELAKALDVTQPEVSKIERRTDLYISTLREYIRAMGGELEIVAKFRDGEVRITNFSDDAAHKETA